MFVIERQICSICTKPQMSNTLHYTITVFVTVQYRANTSSLPVSKSQNYFSNMISWTGEFNRRSFAPAVEFRFILVLQSVLVLVHIECSCICFRFDFRSSSWLCFSSSFYSVLLHLFQFEFSLNSQIFFSSDFYSVFLKFFCSSSVQLLKYVSVLTFKQFSELFVQFVFFLVFWL